ncbi:MAG: hypothetical protein LBI95_03880 [Holosporales bacterium]|jgi:chromosomal replication initiation ATPase DnaA|nr:hypothetical protein [Holosporales bacterium]
MSDKFNQLHLPISWAFSIKSEDFIVNECNQYAFKWLEKWPFKIHDNFVCLVGEKGAGKTHLSTIWANKLNAKIVTSSNNIFSEWYGISETNEQRYFVLDDADEINDDLLLFYIYNTIREKNSYLLLTSKTPPSKWGLKFEDIRSRVATINVIKIQSPNEAAMISIIKKMLLHCGIKTDEKIVSYIANRIERSYESINYWINQFDTTLKRKQSKFSIKFIKNFIK